VKTLNMAKCLSSILLLNIAWVYSMTFCDDVGECQDLVNIEEDYICRGYQSCANTDIESTALTFCLGNEACIKSTTLQANAVHCYGYEACSKSASIEAIDGDVVCSGINACTDIEGDIKASVSITCAGVGSCKGVQGDLISNDQIFCSAEYACADIGGTIYGYYVAASATDAARNNVFDIEDKGYFAGSYSGHGSTISCKGNIQCDGAYSCGKATMDAHDDVRLFGYASGYKSLISYTPIVYAHGYYSAAYSDIHSIAGSKMTVQFFGHYSGYYANVWCEMGSVCTVQCEADGCLEAMIFYETDNIKDAKLTIEPKACVEHQGKVYENVNCPVLMPYTRSQKAKVQGDRAEVRENTEKWDRLDDVYDQGTPGEPQWKLQANAVMGVEPLEINDEVEDEVEEVVGGKVNVMEGKFDERETNVITYLIVFGGLLACFVICILGHWVCSNRKGTERLEAALLYT